MRFQVMAKPIGAKCNLDCTYCYYSEKASLYHDQDGLKMPPEVLEEFIRQHLACQDTEEVSFVWQGGEPTLLGIDFFEQVLRLQDKYGAGKKVVNSIQTNGTLLNHEWGAFLGRHGFLVGLSIDGPRELHDQYRVGRGGRPTFDAVMAGLDVLVRHKVAFNTLTVVNDRNARRPLQVYEFLRGLGHGHMQFIPVVERRADVPAVNLGLDLAMPPSAQASSAEVPVTPWSVTPQRLADFYLAIFDQWVRHDVGSVFVQFFEVALANWVGAGSGLCNFSPTCGSGPVLEHNGDLYSCDHYVYPVNRLGNIMDTPLAELMASQAQGRFGDLKLDALPDCCRSCEVRLLCHGDCPKNRFAVAPDGGLGLSYLCPAYKAIFSHMAPYLGIMADLLRAGQPAAAMMGILQQGRRSNLAPTPGRNAPCPCGSGKKYKRCCGA